MPIDNDSLMIAIAFSGAALMMVLLIAWLNSRRDSYLFSWTVGISFVVIALFALGMRGGAYDLVHQLVPYALLLIGMSAVLVGAFQFRHGTAPLVPLLALLAFAEAAMATPTLLGWSGVGTIALNTACALIMALCAWQYWAGRAESPVVLTVNALIYAVTGASFLACAVVLTAEQSWVLTAPPTNWAEEFNSLMAIVGLTGTGSLSLTLNHSRMARRHREEANTDSLTGVLNRRALFDRYETIDLPAGTAVLMFDLDHFKQINDHRGHAAGDRVLQRFAEILQAGLRPTDVVARLGGEEFCAVLTGRDREEAAQVAEGIRRAFEQAAIPIGNGARAATVSIGVAINGPAESFSSTLSRADSALYSAKQGGRNQIHAAALRLVA